MGILKKRCAESNNAYHPQKSPAKVSPKPFLDIVLVGSKTRPCQNYLSHQKCSWFETFLGTKITIRGARNVDFSKWRSGSHRDHCNHFRCVYPSCFIHGYSNFIEDSLHPFFSTFSKLFLGYDSFAA